ncbi:hypothetical protein CFY87_03595 [Actinobacillus seminis]|uniref:Uncharacterized protein n=1 Tax=Actinobacillus seminis TaxID=722 RepID=A0A263HCQ8_9PAST|nr:hypothetical protein [Actinobacillus seminis]OZN25243.1 hypothetical protein CFY87_03595 [Actinobacillus seminis]SUU36075.1 Uncharacterised protein [Actinobacillus seminis]
MKKAFRIYSQIYLMVLFIYTSYDGTGKYRPASVKHKSSYAITGVQDNFERITKVFDSRKGKYVEHSESNLHLNIKE